MSGFFRLCEGFSQRTRSSRRGYRKAAGLGLLLLCALAQADQALIIAVNKYADPHPKELKGPENDAADMAAFCRKNGYALPDSRYLLGSKATKAAVMGALESLKSVKPGERVIVFFAGHGANRGNVDGKPDCCLLPYDFVDGKRETAIGVDEFYAAMKAIPTKANRTVILDSCFSGGMARDLAFQARSYSPFRARSGVLVLPGAEGQTQAGVPTGGGTDKICYLTAAKATEQALETEIEGKPHGLFTKALIPELGKDQTCEQTRANVATAIAKIIASKNSTRKQTPDVTDEYRKVLALKGTPAGAAAAPVAVAPPKAVWDLVQKEQPDPKQLKLSVVPNQSALRVGQAVKMSVTVGSDGYLVVVWSKDKIELQVPRQAPNGALQAVAVEAGKTYPIYSGSAGQVFTKPGGNRMSAFLFKNPVQAQELVNALANGNGLSIAELQSRGLADAAQGDGYVTAGLSFEVGDELPGNLRVADGGALLDALTDDQGPFEQTFGSRVNRAVLNDLVRRRASIEDPRAFATEVTMLVNRALEALGNSPLVPPGDETGFTPAQTKTVKEATDKLKSATPEEARVLNARLLAALRPKLVVEIKDEEGK